MMTYSLKELRKKSGKTQMEVAMRTGITPTYLSLLESGKRKPSEDVKKQLAKVYNVRLVAIHKAVEKSG